MADSRTVRNSGRRRAQRGVSLLEILVVLVLLVLGILIIVRLFPSGFFSIESAGNAALADGLGSAALGAQTQDLGSLPDAILPGGMDTNGRANGTAADASYNPDDPNTLNNARTVQNETITVPSRSAAGGSTYVIKFGPAVLGTTTTPILPAGDLTQLSQYFTVNGLPWQAVPGDMTTLVTPQSDGLEDDTQLYQSRFLVDLAHRQIAVPYAPYALDGTTTTGGVKEAVAYDQRMIVSITASNGLTYTEWLNVKAGLKRDDANPYAPHAANKVAYLADTASNYHGGWFDPTGIYGDTAYATPQQTVPLVDASNNPIRWTSVTVYRTFQALDNTAAFGPDPYQFMLKTDDTGATNANVGAVAFNPLAAGGSGIPPLKAQVSYQTVDWSILHEDRDIPALSGSDTSAIRLTLKNLKRAGDPNPDNTIYGGIAGAGSGIIIQDLDSGAVIAPAAATAPTYDPTDPAAPLYDEDLNGTSTDPARINVSYATGRLTFGAGVFGDNKAHRVRIFYQGDANWTVAVQKAPAYYAQLPNVNGTDPNLAPAQCAFDTSVKALDFPRSDAGKTVEVDGIVATLGTGTTATTKAYPSVTAAIGSQTPPTGGQYVTLDLSGLFGSDTPTAVTFSAVRGLSSRAVVAWKERNQWKVHTVDTILTRPQP